jgi:hypothetical protein
MKDNSLPFKNWVDEWLASDSDVIKVLCKRAITVVDEEADTEHIVEFQYNDTDFGMEVTWVKTESYVWAGESTKQNVMKALDALASSIYNYIDVNCNDALHNFDNYQMRIKESYFFKLIKRREKYVIKICWSIASKYNYNKVRTSNAFGCKSKLESLPPQPASVSTPLVRE